MERTRKSVEWLKVHIFISSTFNDMHAERDYLVKKVFPELQEWCEQRKLRLVDIDLRWGVTEQDATNNRNAVKVCLERIDDCRPFFLCFIGQRRGWVPNKEEVSLDTYNRFPELRNYIEKSSITELEILHALINPLHRGIKYDERKLDEKYEKVQHAFFYLRDSSYLNRLPAKPRLLRETYTNEGIEDLSEREHHEQELKKWRVDFEKTGQHYTAKWNEDAATPEIMLPLSSPSSDPQNIARWQKQWAKAGIEVKGINIDEDPALAEKAGKFNELLCRGRLADFISNGNELKDVILEDLKTAIAARYPEHVETIEDDELQKELDQQEEFLYINSEGFIKREGSFSELDDYLNNDSRQLFVLTAPGGMGKSMLLANWIDRCKNHPESDHTLHFRFVGQSDRSTTLPNLLRSLLLELQQIAHKIPPTKMETVTGSDGNETSREFPFDIPQDPIKLQTLWQEQLALIGEKGKTVIVIDAINQLERGLSELTWLPLYGLSENIKLIISFREDASDAHALLERFAVNKEHIYLAQVKPFVDMEDRRTLVNTYLNQYLKKIDARHLEEIIALKGAENPLFLKVVLSELRVFGSFVSLAEKIHSDFGDSPESAFDGTLRRLENDPAYSAILPKDAVPLLFGLMAHARYGLSAEELAGMFRQSLGLTETEEQKVLIQETVHLFLRQVRPFLARRDGKFDFFYESFKNAALERYVQVSSAEPRPKRPAQEWHWILAGYFGRLPLWESKEQFKPTKRKVAELPYHQTMGEMWEEVEKTLCDLLFVEAKCAARQVFELQADYQLALNYLPERLAEAQAERDRGTGIQRWTAELIAFSKAWNNRRDQLARGESVDKAEPRLLDTPSSCRIWTEKEIAAECQRIIENPNRLDRLRSFARFVQGEYYALLEFGQRPGFLIQHAINHAPAGPVHKEAEKKLGSVAAPMLLRQWPLKAVFNPKPALLRTLEGHSFWVSHVSVTPDGRYAVSGGQDGRIEVWDLESGQCLRVLEGHTSCVSGVSVTPDGRYAVSASQDATLRVWDLASGQCLRTLEGYTCNVFSVTPDGRCAVSASWGGVRAEGTCDDRLRVWDLESGQCLHILAGHNNTVCGVSVTPDGRRAVSASSDKTLRVWDLESGQCLHILEGHAYAVRSVSVTPDGQRAVSGSDDSTLRVWDLESGQCLRVLEGHAYGVMSVSVTPDGQRAVSGNDSTLRVWDMKSGRCLRILERPATWSGSISLTSDCRLAVSCCGWDRLLQVWDLESGQCLRTREGHTSGVASVSVTPNGQRAVSASSDKTLRVWDLESGQCLRVLEGHTGMLDIVAITPDGRRAVSGSWDQTVRIWDLEDGRCLWILEGHISPVGSVKITPDGRNAISVGGDNTLRVWDLKRGKCLHILKGHTESVLCVGVTPDGRRAVSGSMDATLRVWDLKRGKCLHILAGYARSIEITPDGRYAVSASQDVTLRVWDLASGQCLRTMEGHTLGVESVAVTPDGRCAVSGSRDKTLRVWNLESGQCLRVLEGHTGSVSGVNVTPDGQHAVSRSDDKTLRVWNLERGKCVAVFVAAPAAIRSIAISPPAGSIVYGTVFGDIIILELRGIDFRTPVLLDNRDTYIKPKPILSQSEWLRDAISANVEKSTKLTIRKEDRKVENGQENSQSPISCPHCGGAAYKNNMTGVRLSIILLMLIAAIMLPLHSLWWLFLSIPIGFLAIYIIIGSFKFTIYKCKTCGKWSD